ncbi:MAG TPA: DNA mismatch repair protein MutS [Pirellulales bacterium]|jgi:DNA mismatch repair protein MutS|nr:DNA mismatch repair protein MutS [Pirellulales bacterium]
MVETPMMRQYQDAKAACPDALLLFRMGDFYELFFDDARTAARLLGLALTSRDKSENAVPMAGFPHHQLESYLAKLVSLGLRVAICEQTEDPRQAKGLVKREVTRVVTPGTLTDEALLDPRENNYLAALVTSPREQAEGNIGLAWVELSTGRFQAATVPQSRWADQLACIAPAECLIEEDLPVPLAGIPQVGQVGNQNGQSTGHLPLAAGHASPVISNGQLQEKTLFTRRPVWAFSLPTAIELLTSHFGTATLEGFGFDAGTDVLAIRAAGAILDYLRETQKASLSHLDRLLRYHAGSTLEIDQSTRRSLEITHTLRDGRREGTLLAVLDRTVTSMGSRLMAEWVANPLAEIAPINQRLDAIAELVADARLTGDLREKLRGIYDVQRLLARIITGRASPRDLSHVSQTLAALPALKAKITGRRSELLSHLDIQIDLYPEIRERLETAMVENCPLQSREGGIIRPGYHAELDGLRELATGGKQWIARYQAEEAVRTGIANLKVGFNKVFGYYIEVTHSHGYKIPENYIRKQTVKNAERYITPELKEYEEKVLTADERAKHLEYDLFMELREFVAGQVRRLQATAAALAQLDVLVGLADLARSRNYCRPTLVDEPVLAIRDGRHPVLDGLLPDGSFVPNDTVASPDEGLILLITGPNMAGKSTYIRQVASMTLMAQIGSFVPAREATMGLADHIFARVGASDELSRGQSTFMVEMTETARILNTATPRSLVILDEIGRGTSTYDGVSLAWAVVEYLHDHSGCRTLFATHYHELTDLAKTLSSVRNLNVAVREWDEQVVFLHKILEGAADKSYGIHVARLAGVPAEVNHRAKQILAQLEQEHLDSEGRPKIGVRGKKTRAGDLQLTLFAAEVHPLVEKVRCLDLDSLTPMAALQKLHEWQSELLGELPGTPQTRPR